MGRDGRHARKMFNAKAIRVSPHRVVELAWPQGRARQTSTNLPRLSAQKSPEIPVFPLDSSRPPENVRFVQEGTAPYSRGEGDWGAVGHRSDSPIAGQATADSPGPWWEIQQFTVSGPLTAPERASARDRPNRTGSCSASPASGPSGDGASAGAAPCSEPCSGAPRARLHR